MFSASAVPDLGNGSDLPPKTVGLASCESPAARDGGAAVE